MMSEKFDPDLWNSPGDEARGQFAPAAVYARLHLQYPAEAKLARLRDPAHLTEMTPYERIVPSLIIKAINLLLQITSITPDSAHFLLPDDAQYIYSALTHLSLHQRIELSLALETDKQALIDTAYRANRFLEINGFMTQIYDHLPDLSPDPVIYKIMAMLPANKIDAYLAFVRETLASLLVVASHRPQVRAPKMPPNSSHPPSRRLPPHFFKDRLVALRRADRRTATQPVIPSRESKEVS